MIKQITGALALFTTAAVIAACASSENVGTSKNRYDTDGDGYLTPEEYSTSKISAILKFEDLDADGDGLLSESELSLHVPDGARKRSGGKAGGRGGRNRT